MTLIETERLILRRFTPDDWQGLHEYLSLESVVKYEPYGVFTEEDCRKEAKNRAEMDCFWAVCLKENGKLIGNVYFQRQEPQEWLTWELGYVFNPAYGGRGYATEAARAMLKLGFEQLGARRIIAMCNPLNERSWRLLERLGMRREGHLLQNLFFKRDKSGNPIWCDTYEYGILSTEWMKQQRPG